MSRELKGKATKKPVTINYCIWDGENIQDVFDFCEGNAHMENTCESGAQMVIKTLEGQHIATIGDYIIQGVAGEYYPCKPDIFAKTYDIAENPELLDAREEP